MGTRGPLPHPLQNYVVALYRRGDLVTLEEGALIAGVTRPRIMRWLVQQGIDWRRQRLHFLAKHRSRAVAAADGKRMPRRRTKAQLRAVAAEAKREWNRSGRRLD